MNATQESAPEPAVDDKILIEVYKTLHARVKLIRDHHRLSIPETIQRFAGPAIEAEWRRIVRQMNDELPAAEVATEGG